MSAVAWALSVPVALLWLAGLGYLLVSHRAALRHFADPTPPPLPEPAPGVSLLKPTEGADEDTAAAFASHLALDYPGPVEVIVGTIRERDPVVEVTRQLQTAHPAADLKLLFAELRGTNRKTSIMLAQADAAAHDLLVFTDADGYLPPDILRHVVPRLVDPAVGAVTCLPRGIDCRTIGAKLIALHYDFVYLPQWMAALETTGIQWAIGHLMAQRRDVLQAYGGFETFLDALADDYELGHRAAELGLRVEVPPVLIDTAMPQSGLGPAVQRLQRWMRTIRRARPGSFGGLVCTYPVAWATLLALLHPTAPWAWSLLATTVALRLALAGRLQRVIRVPDWRRMAWLLPLLDLIEWGTFIGAYTGSTVVWGGRRYRLQPDGTLEPLDRRDW